LQTIPIIVSLMMAWLFTWLITYTGLTLPAPIITPLAEPPSDVSAEEALSSPSPYLNALLVVGAMFVGGVLIVSLLRYRRFIRFLGLALVGLVGFASTGFYFPMLVAFVSVHLVSLWPVVSLSVTALIILVLRAGKQLPAMIASTYVAASAGSLAGVSFPFWTTIVLVFAVSAFDTYAVFKGHLRRLAGHEETSLPGLTVEFHGLTVGLGDLLFYSILVAFTISHWGAVSGLFASIGIFAGFVTTLVLVEMVGMAPGLPVSLLTALALAYAVTLLF